eukprot:NODE_7035_length_591_cov_9.376384_g6037_i0.p1 GENE.NODE_7035_length_591_cov_9.376384_g6037_i0~~NODE_7035_length_591_cov_9.376384_g6037_i0.p1  ORF type:complete len:129 (-),score=19.01 NODE_7035_length_591_cov_9.376384_g6037_i0:92-478(-)
MPDVKFVLSGELPPGKNAQTFSISVVDSWTVKELKQQIRENHPSEFNDCAFAQKNMTLIFSGKRMEDERAVSDYRLPPDPTVLLVLQPLKPSAPASTPEEPEKSAAPSSAPPSTTVQGNEGSHCCSIM